MRGIARRLALLGIAALAGACATDGSGGPGVPVEPGRSYGVVALAPGTGVIGYHSFCQPTVTGRFIANNLSILLDCDDPDRELIFGDLGGASERRPEVLRLGDGSVVLVARLRDLDPDDVRPEVSGAYVLAGRAMREGEAVFLTGRTLAYRIEAGAVHWLGRLGPGGIAWEAPGGRIAALEEAVPALGARGGIRAEPPQEVTLSCVGAGGVRSCRADPPPGG